MTRRSRVYLGGIALAAIVTIITTGCTDNAKSANPADPPSASGTDLTGVVFSVHRDPG